MLIITCLNAFVKCKTRLCLLVTQIPIDFFSQMVGHMIVVFLQIGEVLVRSEFAARRHVNVIKLYYSVSNFRAFCVGKYATIATGNNLEPHPIPCVTIRKSVASRALSSSHQRDIGHTLDLMKIPFFISA